MRELKKSESLKLKGSNLNYIGIIEGSKKVIIYECKIHGIIHQRFDVHVKSLKCSKCNVQKNGKYTYEYLKNLIKEKNSPYLYNLNETVVYKSTDKIEIICKTHGIFTQRMHNHFNLNQNCPKCVNKKVEINQELKKDIENRGIKILKYNGYRESSLFECKKHGEFKTNINNVKIHGCCKCSTEQRINKEKVKFIIESKKIWNNILDIDYNTLIYKGQRYKMKIYSKTIGWIHQLPYNHLKGFLPRKSTGELIIKKLLKSNNIKFETEKTFEKCKNIKKLRFDFYLPAKNICIEYNGEQHYNAIDKFDGKDRLEYQIKNDKIKKDFCIKNNLNLIVISYKDSILEKIKPLIC